MGAGQATRSARRHGPALEDRDAAAQELERLVEPLELLAPRQLLGAGVVGPHRHQRGDRRGGDHSRPQVGRRVAEVGGDRLRDDRLEAGHQVALVGGDRLVLGAQAMPQRLARFIRLQLRQQLGDPGAQRVERRLAWRPAAQPLGEGLRGLLEVGEQHVLLRREVGEERARCDVGGVGDVGHGRCLEPALGEQPEGGALDRAARLLLLALPETHQRGS
jgi:hypothetical protein